MRLRTKKPKRSRVVDRRPHRVVTRRPRRRLRAKPILVVLLAVNLYLGITRSPITSLRHVRVEGALESDQTRIRADLERLSGIACLQVNPFASDGRILESPEVRSTTMNRNVFGYAHVYVAYRIPVARLTKVGNWALSAEGVAYPTTEDLGGLPLVSLPMRAMTPILTLSGAWEPARIAYLATQVHDLDPKLEKQILIDDGGVVILLLGSGRVILGSCESLDEKLDVLRKHLSRNPQELSEYAELNLTSPDRPALLANPKSSPH